MQISPTLPTKTFPAFLSGTMGPLGNSAAASTATAPAVSASTDKISLLLIEDHAALVEGMLPRLADEYDVTTVSTMEELQLALKVQKFRLAIVDLTLHRQFQGMKMMPLLRNAGTKFLVFSGTADDWHICAAIRFGAMGYVDKREKIGVLLAALESTAKNKRSFPKSFMENLRARKNQVFPKLGPSEKILIDLIINSDDPELGEIPSNRDLAEAMHLKRGRIQNMFSRLSHKFDAVDGTRTALQAELKACGYFTGVDTSPLAKFDLDWSGE